MKEVRISELPECSMECAEWAEFPWPEVGLYILCETHNQWWEAIEHDNYVDTMLIWDMTNFVPFQVATA